MPRRTGSGHDVSILITAVDAAGRVRGEQPRSNVSMTIMRPRQHGHGCASGLGSASSARAVIAGLGLCRRHVEQSRASGDVVGACAAGEQAVVADAVEAVRQDVDQEAADELGGGERHDLLALAAFGTIVLPSEGDAVAVAGDQPAVGDGDAVGIARQIGQHRLWPAERALGIDHPFGSA